MKPTYEDIIKYHSQATRLLVGIDCYSLPAEIQILQVVEGGAIFQFNAGWGTQWVKTEQVDVLNVFPPQELVARMRDLDKPVTTIGSVKKVLAKADNINVLADKMIELYEGKKKCKKKKNRQ